MMNMMMNSPLMAVVASMRSGSNPMALVQQMAMQNPEMRQFMQMVNGKSPAQLRQMAENMAKERGTSVEEVAQQLGIAIPNK